VKIEGDSIRKIEGCTASWNKARKTASSRAGRERECRAELPPIEVADLNHQGAARALPGV
jgi:hypothetical protein